MAVMGSIDGISEAIGNLRSDVKHMSSKIDAIASIVPRVEALENSRALDKGKAIGISAVAGTGAGAAVVAGWKALALKLGF